MSFNTENVVPDDKEIGREKRELLIYQLKQQWARAESRTRGSSDVPPSEFRAVLVELLAATGTPTFLLERVRCALRDETYVPSSSSYEHLIRLVENYP